MKAHSWPGRVSPAAARAPAPALVTGPVTMDMVAREAGVSLSTVSRILNGTAAVSPGKTAAVSAAIEKLGFRPDPVARGLAGGRTMSIGVLTQDVSSPFYGEALLGIEDELEKNRYIPLFVSGHWSEPEERKALDALLLRRVDGLIVLAGRLPARSLQGYARQTPMVVVGRRLGGPTVTSLTFDNRAGSALGAQHLIDLGHRRIAYVTGAPDHQDGCEREAGYRDALERAGIAFDPELLAAGDFTEAGGLMAVNSLLDRGVHFTAVMASNDQAAIGVLLGLHRRGLRVPDDVSVVGFDDLAPARFSIPPLTTVRQSVYETGAIAARCILDILQGRRPHPVLPAPTLEPRESTRRHRR